MARALWSFSFFCQSSFISVAFTFSEFHFTFDAAVSVVPFFAGLRHVLLGAASHHLVRDAGRQVRIAHIHLRIIYLELATTDFMVRMLSVRRLMLPVSSPEVRSRMMSSARPSSANSKVSDLEEKRSRCAPRYFSPSA